MPYKQSAFPKTSSPVQKTQTFWNQGVSNLVNSYNATNDFNNAVNDIKNPPGVYDSLQTTTYSSEPIIFPDTSTTPSSMDNNDMVIAQANKRKDGETGRAAAIRQKLEGLGENTAKFARLKGKYNKLMAREKEKFKNTSQRVDKSVDNKIDRIQDRSGLPYNELNNLNYKKL